MKSPSYVFWLFLAAGLITFFPTIGAGFVYDFLGWQKEYENGTFADIINCFGYKGNHQLLHLFFYSFYQLFHIQGLPWYLLFTTLHAFNAWLLYRWIIRMAMDWGIELPAGVAILSGMLFLVHPYTIEPVVWKVCLHYLLSMAAVMGLLLLHRHYVQDGKSRFLYITLGIYGASMFLLEISFVTPLLMTGWLLLQRLTLPSPAIQWRRSIQLAGGLWGLLAAYLVLNKITLKSWVGHYGAEQHFNLDLLAMFSTEMKYLAKHVFFVRHYSFNAKSQIFDQWLSMPAVSFFLLTALLALVIWYLIRLKKRSGSTHVMMFGTLASMLYVLPIANLYFYHLHVGMNDRYSYIPMAMLCAAYAAATAKLPKWTGRSLLIGFILLSVVLQQQTNSYWKKSTIVLKSLVEKFRWHDRDPVFILNSPDNYKGAVMASIYGEPTGIDELIDYQTDKPYNGQMYDVYQYNMTGMSDGVTVEQTGPLQLKVTFKQWGNWWHKNGIGASSYENEFYKAEVLDYPYLLTFKQFPPNGVILYQDGLEWKEFTWAPAE